MGVRISPRAPKPVWRNSIRATFRALCPKGRVGANPIAGTRLKTQESPNGMASPCQGEITRVRFPPPAPMERPTICVLCGHALEDRNCYEATFARRGGVMEQVGITAVCERCVSICEMTAYYLGYNTTFRLLTNDR